MIISLSFHLFVSKFRQIELAANRFLSSVEKQRIFILWNCDFKPLRKVRKIDSFEKVYLYLFLTDISTKISKCIAFLGNTAFITTGSKVVFSWLGLPLLCGLSAQGFIYPKLLLHIFKGQNMLFQNKQSVFGKAMYLDPFWEVENMPILAPRYKLPRVTVFKKFVKFLCSNHIAI